MYVKAKHGKNIDLNKRERKKRFKSDETIRQASKFYSDKNIIGNTKASYYHQHTTGSFRKKIMILSISFRRTSNLFLLFRHC